MSPADNQFLIWPKWLQINASLFPGRRFDVLVKWEDGTRNVVSSMELELVPGSSPWKTGAKVRMWWQPTRRYYHGEHDFLPIILPDRVCFLS